MTGDQHGPFDGVIVDEVEAVCSNRLSTLSKSVKLEMRDKSKSKEGTVNRDKNIKLITRERRMDKTDLGGPQFLSSGQMKH